MRSRLTIFFALIHLTPFAQVIENNTYNNNYYIKDSLLYKSTDSISYSGKFIEYYPGEPKINGTYKEGLKDGRFQYYDTKGRIKKIEYYNKGKKHGIFKEFFNGYSSPNILISKESYSNDTLISAKYWDVSGQITKSIINGDTTLFKIDSSIFSLVPYIKGLQEEETTNYSYPMFNISKEEFCSSIDNLFTVICLLFNDDDLNRGYDTLFTTKYSVKSYYLETPIFDKKPESPDNDAHIDWKSEVKNNILGDELKNLLCDNYPAFLFISHIIIVDEHGFELEMQGLRINIVE